jgi:3-oxoacyl-(acyl-carrier-protein) synthase/non-ribosomal peptide synthetase component F/malonyl CoA-acyl carrier protein transacylase
MDPAIIAAGKVGCPLPHTLKLSEVTLVAVGCDCLPEASESWPVHAIAARSDAIGGLRDILKNAYICGCVDAVLEVLNSLRDMGVSEAPLAILVDEAPGASRSTCEVEVEVLPALQHDGLARGSAWEAVVSAVCSRHLETIQDMILCQARRAPEKECIVFEDNSWTYRQVVSMASCVREDLCMRGITPEGGTVGVQALCSDRYAILCLGLYSARYLIHILDRHPSSVAFRLEVCPCQAVIAERDRVALPDDISIPTVFLEDLRLSPDRPIEVLSVEGELSDPIYIEYTSGSTGRPKSVISWNWRMAHWVRWRQFHFPYKPGDEREARNLFFIWYWHITMCQGATTIFYPASMNHDVSALMRYARRHSVSRFDCLTPGLIKALIDVEDTLPDTLKVMISGGEALPTATAREFLEKWPHCKLWNNLASTECSADLCYCRVTPNILQLDCLYVPISDGCIAWQNQFNFIDEELVIQGWNVDPGYLPPTSSENFIRSPCGRQHQYRTGDRATWIDGVLHVMGRVDSIVKIRGHRVDLAGVEALLAACTNVQDVVCVAWRENICSIVVTDNMQAVKDYAGEQSSESHLMVWYEATKLPYTASSKRDRQACRKMLEAGEPDFRLWSNAGGDLLGGPPANDQERLVAAAWKELLGRDVGRDEAFQQAGGHSLMAMKLAKSLGVQPADIFAYHTIALMAQRLSRSAKIETVPKPLAPTTREGDLHAPVAIVGMAGRFPGAPSTARLWEALVAGTDLTSDVPAGPGHIGRKGIVPDLGLDCKFWGIPADMAKVMDTAQRTMLETAYEALEDAGMDPLNVSGKVGVVVSGGSLSHYASEILGIDQDELRVEKPDEYFALEIGTDKDYLATTIAYRLNLQGPAELVQTACSSSLVAVVRAVQLLRLRVCDYVICGGASFSPDDPVRKVDGMIWSPDGVCRPFADGANGTVGSDGCGLVVLTLLDDAMKRGEHVYASVIGAATNNDGARKAGFSAPSFEGQVDVLQAAHADAGISSGDIDYIEAHGTGTRLGDPLEVHALTEVLDTERKVLLGSIKSNIGHMNTAAGIPGFIKSALMLHHQRMVPSLHASNPNTLIDWEKTPFSLAESGHDWNGKLIGVSSFGIGGTNAHVVLEAVPCKPIEPPRSVHLFTASAKCEEALQDLCVSLSKAPEQQSARVEATLLARPRFGCRSFALRSKDLPAAPKIHARRPVVLLFPGQGGAYAEMGSSLEKEGLVNCKCAGLGPADIVKASLAIAVELERQGIVVEAAVGHSVGEWAAAAFAGAISFEDCFALAELRGRLMSTMETGMMVSVRAQLSQVEDLAVDGVEVACINGAETVVLAGPHEVMSRCISELEKRGITSKQLRTEHAFHTAAVNPILQSYTEALKAVKYSSTRFPVLSNVTGDWHGSQCTSAEYWAQHLRQPVRFYDNLKRLARRFPTAVVVEVGPSVLAGVVAREATRIGVDWQVVPTMRERDEVTAYMNCLGMLWAHADLKPDLPVATPKKRIAPDISFSAPSVSGKEVSGHSHC